MSSQSSQPQNQKKSRVTIVSLLKEALGIMKRLRPIIEDMIESCNNLKPEERPEHCEVLNNIIVEMDSWAEKLMDTLMSAMERAERSQYTRGYYRNTGGYKRGSSRYGKRRRLWPWP